MTQTTLQTFKANLGKAAVDRAYVRLGGGVFNPNEVREVHTQLAHLMDEAVALKVLMVELVEAYAPLSENSTVFGNRPFAGNSDQYLTSLWLRARASVASVTSAQEPKQGVPGTVTGSAPERASTGRETPSPATAGTAETRWKPPSRPEPKPF